MPAHHLPRDLTGQVFGRLTALCKSELLSTSKRKRWLCRCECGNEVLVNRSELTRKTQGSTRSCGCLKSETSRKRCTTHGKCKTPEHASWTSMIQRCENEHRKRFNCHGGRGIQVCPEWRHSFGQFLADMGPKPSPRHSIERIDNDGNYEPGNCRWATQKEQTRNTRQNLFIEFRGERKTVAEWAEIMGICPDPVYKRLERGWSPEKALLAPLRITKRKAP